MFVFVAITYNHEDYIIEHLESIKYQIKQYGRGKEFKLIISDDGSQDNTIALVRGWLEYNQNLFEDIEFMIAQENQGIVANFLKATNAVKRLPFKLLAGDDLYYKNNIFDMVDALENCEVIFTPVINFDADSVVNSHQLDNLLICKNAEQIKKTFRYANIFNAPGTFFSNELIRENGLREFISLYKWIEDLPSFYYLFNMRPKIEYYINIQPYIMYRQSVGISTNNINEKNNVFTIERNKLEKDLDMVLNKYPKYINPHRYYWKFRQLKIKYFDSKYNPEVIKYNRIIDQSLQEASKYLELINFRKLEFYKFIGKEF